MADTPRPPTPVPSGQPTDPADLAEVSQKILDAYAPKLQEAQQARAQGYQRANRAAALMTLFQGPEAAAKLRDQLTTQADLPVKSVGEQMQQVTDALKQAGGAGELLGQSVALRTKMAQADPNDPASLLLHQAAVKNGLIDPRRIPPGSISALQMVAGMPALKEMADTLATQSVADKTAAEAEQIRTTTGTVVPTAKAQIRLLGEQAGAAGAGAQASRAQAGLTGAQTQQTLLRTGGGVVAVTPYGTHTISGKVGITDQDIAKYKDNVSLNTQVHQAADLIKQELGGKDVITDRESMARVEPVLEHLRSNLGAQNPGLGTVAAGPLLDKMLKDPAEWKDPRNWLQLNKQGVRLDTLKEISDRTLGATGGGAFTFTPHKAAGGPMNAVRVQSKAERDALPAGARYIGPDGKTYVKR